MSLTPDEFNEIKSINKREQLFWEEFKPHKKDTFTECGLITVWYLPKLIEHIENLERKLSFST